MNSTSKNFGPHEPIDFWLPFAIVFSINFLYFIFCQCVKDNSWIDVFWGLIFIEPIVGTLIVQLIRGQQIPIRSYLILGLVTLWALRLALHIGLRHKGEDFRYQDMRKRWSEGGSCEYYSKTIGYIFMMQGLFSLVANAACLYTVILTPNTALRWNDYLGVGVWFIGFAIEVAADLQLRAHLKDTTPGKGKFCKRGLWKYSRHPNYFGEAVLWWGPYIICCSVYFGWTMVFAPLFIGYLVRFLSGVPMLEAKYEGNPEFKHYCRETNVFALWCNKTVNEE